MKKKTIYSSTNDVINAFHVFLLYYQAFRNSNGLTKKIKNVHEILTAMSDKHGRICRNIKHQERKDPKDNWQNEISSALVGYIVYAIMLLENYNIDVSEGMKKELEEALKQHRK